MIAQEWSTAEWDQTLGENLCIVEIRVWVEVGCGRDTAIYTQTILGVHEKIVRGEMFDMLKSTLALKHYN